MYNKAVNKSLLGSCNLSKGIVTRRRKGIEFPISYKELFFMGKFHPIKVKSHLSPVPSTHARTSK